MKLKVVTGPTVEPITVAEARAHMHLDSTDDALYIAGLIVSARMAAESFTRRAFITQTLEVAVDDVPSERYIELLRAPLIAVSSLKWYTDADVSTTVDSSDYYADTYSEPGRLVLRTDASWPSNDLRVANGIIVQYTAGYGATAASVPEQIKTAIKETVKVWYDGGDDAGTSIDERLPQLATALLKPYRLVML